MTIKKLLHAFVLPLLLFSGQLFAQERLVTGTVTDSSGAPIANASVVAKGTRAGTQTSSSGAFSVRVPTSATTLTISSVGFGTSSVAITEGPVNVTLKTANTALSEVVVIGYGTQRRRDVTGSIVSVSSKDFVKGPITTPEQLIAGKVAGVQINSNSGQPGSGSRIRIRGGTSLNASNEPLIVIDGVPISPVRNLDGTPSIAGASDPLSLINPNDIESFTVLKDASAAAIYGNRAANGVILITTKKGTAGKLRVNFSSLNSISK
ncbi:MAG: TonB-dependent receptor, partial [Segetibacter sp.]|nr:TonB-dependent receptor [Segetibacter sp.]